MGENWIPVATVVGVAVVALLLVLLAIGILTRALATAALLLAWAAEHGFVGVALYVILWVVATPVMIVVCIVGGAIGLWMEWRASRRVAPKKSTKPPEHGSPEYLDWANRRGRWANE